MKRFYSRL